LYIVRPGICFKTQYGYSVELPESKKGFGNIVAWAELLTTNKLITKAFRLSSVEILAKNTHNQNFTYMDKHSEEALNLACQRAENPQWFFYELTLHHMSKGNWNVAQDNILKALEIDNDDAEFHRIFLKVQVKCNGIDKTQLASELMKLSDASPDNTNVHHDLLMALMSTREYEKALNIATKLLAIEPFNSGLYYSKAECLQRLGLEDFSELAINRAIAINPGIAHYYTLKSSLLAAKNKLNKAIQVQKKAVSLGGGFAVLLHYGNLLLKAKRFKEAVEIYDKASGYHPNHPDLIKNRLQAQSEIQ